MENAAAIQPLIRESVLVDGQRFEVFEDGRVLRITFENKFFPHLHGWQRVEHPERVDDPELREEVRSAVAVRAARFDALLRALTEGKAGPHA